MLVNRKYIFVHLYKITNNFWLNNHSNKEIGLLNFGFFGKCTKYNQQFIFSVTFNFRYDKMLGFKLDFNSLVC